VSVICTFIVKNSRVIYVPYRKIFLFLFFRYWPYCYRTNFKTDWVLSSNILVDFCFSAKQHDFARIAILIEILNFRLWNWTHNCPLHRAVLH
jgi:hypothetical protein